MALWQIQKMKQSVSEKDKGQRRETLNGGRKKDTQILKLKGNEWTREEERRETGEWGWEMIDGAKKTISCFIWSALLCNQQAHTGAHTLQSTHALSTSLTQAIGLQSTHTGYWWAAVINNTHWMHTHCQFRLAMKSVPWCRWFWPSHTQAYTHTHNHKRTTWEKWNAAQTTTVWRIQHVSMAAPPTLFYSYFGFWVLDTDNLSFFLSFLFYFLYWFPKVQFISLLASSTGRSNRRVG